MTTDRELLEEGYQLYADWAGPAPTPEQVGDHPVRMRSWQAWRDWRDRVAEQLGKR